MIKALAFDLQFTLVFLEDFTLTKWFKLFDKGFRKVEIFLKEELDLNFDERTLYRTFRRIRNRYFAKAITAEDQQYFTEETFIATFSKMNIKISDDDLVKCYELYHSEEIPAWTPRSDLKKIMKGLSKKYKLFMITNGSERVASKVIKLQGINDYFYHSFYNARKPRLDAFKKIKEIMNPCEFNELVMVGDDLNTDIRPALELGMKAVHLHRGYEYLQHHATLDVKPDVRIDKLEELEAVIEEL